MKTIREIKKQGLPLHVFPDEVSRFIKDFALGSGSQQSFVSAGVLACAAGMCCKHLLTVKGGYSERSNLFIAVVGAPGVSKSAPIKVALGPMMQVEAKNNKAYKAKQREWEKSLKAKLITNIPAIFEEHLQHYLDKGWELHGTTFSILAPTLSFCQAITLKEDHDV